MGRGDLLEVENEAVEETEDKGGTGTGKGEEGQVSVLYVEHHHTTAPLPPLTDNPANILAKLSVYQPLLLARRRHFTERSLEDRTGWTTASMFDRYIELREALRLSAAMNDIDPDQS